MNADSGKSSGSRVVETVAGAFGLLAGIVALVYVFGGIVLLLRLQVRGLRAEVVVATLPREFLVSVGLAVLFQFVVFLAVLLVAFIPQQEVPVSQRMDVYMARHKWLRRALRQVPTRRQAIRAIIVFLATVLLAIPLVRWIGWGGSGWQATAIVLPTIVLWVMFATLALRFSGRRSRWSIGVVIFGFALASSVFAIVGEPRELWLLVVFWAAALTALPLWFLLEWLDGSRQGPPLGPAPSPPEATGERRFLLVRTGLLALLAFLIFVPWRAALEVASLPGLDIAVCTTDKPSTRFGGLFIGENDNSVYVGEGEWSVVEVTSDSDRERVLSAGFTRGEAEEELQRLRDDSTVQGDLETQRRSPRIAEIPRSEIRRIFLGKRAKEIDCSRN